MRKAGAAHTARKAVFLDRDGVLNRPVLNPATGEYESPHRPDDLELYPWTTRALTALADMGYMLFLISNQPSFAKGKASLEDLDAVHEKLHRLLTAAGISFAEYYYCHHHPEGVVPGYSGACLCRKPGTLFLSKAREAHDFSVRTSWLIGDRDSDIACGSSFGFRTILINEAHSSNKRGMSRPDFQAENLEDAVRIIVEATAQGEQERVP